MVYLNSVVVSDLVLKLLFILFVISLKNTRMVGAFFSLMLPMLLTVSIVKQLSGIRVYSGPAVHCFYLTLIGVGHHLLSLILERFCIVKRELLKEIPYQCLYNMQL